MILKHSNQSNICNKHDLASLQWFNTFTDLVVRYDNMPSGTFILKSQLKWPILQGKQIHIFAIHNEIHTKTLTPQNNM